MSSKEFVNLLKQHDFSLIAIWALFVFSLSTFFITMYMVTKSQSTISPPSEQMQQTLILAAAAFAALSLLIRTRSLSVAGFCRRLARIKTSREPIAPTSAPLAAPQLEVYRCLKSLLQLQLCCFVLNELVAITGLLCAIQMKSLQAGLPYLAASLLLQVFCFPSSRAYVAATLNDDVGRRY